MIERASANDMMQLATDVGPVPMQVGAVLVLAPEPGLDPDVARTVLSERLTRVPRLRQRLVWAGVGSGRPVWVDDATFDVEAHVHVRACPAPGDEAALLAVATAILGTRLPLDRPPWDATIVTGLADGSTALVVVFNHVLADGIGGLAVLASLVDGLPLPIDHGFPRPAPSRFALTVDAARSRVASTGRWRHALSTVRDALAELRSDGDTTAARCSLNTPTGSRRATTVVRVDLEAVHAAARAHDATVNDVVLTAVTGALGDLLDQRGEHIEQLVVSVPISARPSAGARELGNAVGVMPVQLPLGGDAVSRLTEIGRITRARKDSTDARGSSAVLLGPLFRAMAWCRVLRWFMDHQHLINTLVTNVRGPDVPLTFAGTAIRTVTPISIVTGNVTVAFAVLSYAGMLTITVNSDADACPDVDRLTERLAQTLATLTTVDGRSTANA